MKDKKGGMNCSGHWYLDGIMMLVGALYLIGRDGWNFVPSLVMSDILPAWGLLFVFLGFKMYKMHHC
ncbi:MAG: hypothetical protein ABH863_05385 [Candidatus Micrarchaeota archaeon]